MQREKRIQDPRNALEYRVGKLLGSSSDRFNFYECEPTSEKGRPCILKVAQTKEVNGLLDKETFLLQVMADYALSLESKNTGKKPYNYGSFFPSPIGSFIPEGQDGRRVSVIGFPRDIEVLSQLVPVSALAQVDRVWVDPRTSAWIVGKLLKVVDFAHAQGISVGSVTSDNTVIERDLHGVIVFDWTRASHHGEGRVPASVAGKELSNVAEIGIAALGGDLATGKLLPNEQLTDGRFEAFLRNMQLGYVTHAGDAHRRFYELIWDMWPNAFHPFTTVPCESAEHHEEGELDAREG